MNINDFGIFIFSMIAPFNRKIVLIFIKYCITIHVCSHLDYAEDGNKARDKQI